MWSRVSPRSAAPNRRTANISRPCAEAQMRAVGMGGEDLTAVESCMGVLDEDRPLELLEGALLEHALAG